jgi:hypothetical protein
LDGADRQNVPKSFKEPMSREHFILFQRKLKANEFGKFPFGDST